MADEKDKQVDAADVADATDDIAEEVAEEPVVEDLTDDPEALKAELAKVRAEKAALEAEQAPHTFWRNAGAGVLIVIGVLLFALAVSAVWLNRTIMDENRFVDTLAPLAQETSIQDYVASSATKAIFDNVDIEMYVRQAMQPLPPEAQAFLATPITVSIQNFVRDAATKVVRSPQFYEVWVKMLRVAHKTFIAAITDKSSGAIQKQGGTITLDVSVLVDQIKAALTDRGLGFVNKVNLPISTQQITLYDSPAIAQLGTLIQFMNAAAYVLPLLALALLAGGVALAANHRKAVLWMGVGIVAFTIIPVQAIYLGKIPFANAALELGGMPSEAAQAAYTIIFRNLVAANRLFAVVGLVFVIGAILAGPSKWATSLRSGFQHGLSNVGPDWDFGTTGEWIDAHAAGLRTTGIILAIVAMLLVPTKTVWTIVWLVVGVLVWFALVAFFGRPRPADKVVATDPDSELPGASA